MIKKAAIIKRIGTLLCMVILILTMFDLAVFADETPTTAGQTGTSEDAGSENGTDEEYWKYVARFRKISA